MRVGKGQSKGLLIGDSSVEISHLLANPFSCRKIKFVNALTTIQLFGGISGLHIDLGKSGLAGINLVDHVLQDLAGVAGCSTLTWLMMYLGVPFRSNPRADSFWDLILKMIAKHLHN